MSEQFTVREIDGHENLAALVTVLDRIWGTSPGKTMLDLAMLIALRSGGHYTAAAFVGDEIVGGCIGFHVEPLGDALHSHIAGVIPQYASMGIGRALKEHQREWCLARGIREVRWTFDPLVSRNAHFNLRSLGAAPVKYHANYYGEMTDGVNQGDESDRLLVAWPLQGAGRLPEPPEAADAAPLLAKAADGRPVIDTGALDADVVAVQTPADIERMRLENPAAARTWRLALREALPEVVESWESLGFDSAHRYIFRRRN